MPRTRAGGAAAESLDQRAGQYCRIAKGERFGAPSSGEIVPASRFARVAVLVLILAACAQPQPQPLLAGPMRPASGVPTAIAANAGKGTYEFLPEAGRAPPTSEPKIDLGPLLNKVRQCWNIDLDKAEPVRPIRIRIPQISAQGTIPPRGASIVDDGGSPSMAAAALRAVENPVCQPWPVPSGGWPKGGLVLLLAAYPD